MSSHRSRRISQGGRKSSTESICRQDSESSTSSSSSSSSSCSWNGGLKDCTLIVMGAGHVGKSALVQQYLSGVFSQNYNPTVEDSYRHLIQLADGSFYSIKIVDTAGYHQFPAMRDLSIRSGHSFAIVFAVIDRTSFHYASDLLQQISDVRGFCGVSVVLVGNKRDLDEDREVSPQEACFLAEKYCCPYVETSARDNLNVQNLFIEVVSRNVSGTNADGSDSEVKKKPTRRISANLNPFRRRSSDSTNSNCAVSTGVCNIM